MRFRPGGFSNAYKIEHKKGADPLRTPPLINYAHLIFIVGEMAGSEVLETDTFKEHNNFPFIYFYKEGRLPTMTRFHNRSMTNNTRLDNMSGCSILGIIY